MVEAVAVAVANKAAAASLPAVAIVAAAVNQLAAAARAATRADGSTRGKRLTAVAGVMCPSAPVPVLATAAAATAVAVAIAVSPLVDVNRAAAASLPAARDADRAVIHAAGAIPVV